MDDELRRREDESEADFHERAAAFHDEHAAEARRRGNVADAERMEERAAAARERAEHARQGQADGSDEQRGR